MRLATVGQTRQGESYFRSHLRLPLYALMEAAGGAVAAAVLQEGRSRVVVVCGKGNNGGDGLVCARRLRDAGLKVEVHLLGAASEYQGDAQRAMRAWLAVGGKVRARRAGEPIAAPETSVVVDALFGTGFRRAPDPRAQRVIAAINTARRKGARVVAVDVPSGLDVEAGLPPGLCVVADTTVTFAPLKIGLLHDGAVVPVGRWQVHAIGAPTLGLNGENALELRTLDIAPLMQQLGIRSPTAFKNSFGHVLVVGGMPGKSGALALSARAALRAGAGLVTVVSREAEVRAAQAFAPELMGIALPGSGPLTRQDLDLLRKPLEKVQAIAVGPGLAVGPETREVVLGLCQTGLRIVVDADGLNSLGLPPRLGPQVVITPHPGEAARLLGLPSAAEVQADRLAAASRLHQKTRATVVLKGARTLVADARSVAICLDGSVKLATAGSGDVLTGLVAAHLARLELPVTAAAELAVAVHARLGSAYPQRHSLVATDLVEAIPEVLQRLSLSRDRPGSDEVAACPP